MEKYPGIQFLSRRMVIYLLVSVSVIVSISACVFFNREPVSNSGPDQTAVNNNSSNSRPVPERTLIVSTATSPPVSVIESLRAEMRAAAPAPALERHAASELNAEGCDEISFAFYDDSGDQNKYIGIYRCPMKGAVVGVSKYDSQVTVIGAIRFDSGTYSKSIMSAEAIN